MASKEARERKLKTQEIAEGWGRMISREAFPNAPGLDVTLAEMEEYAVAASRALVKGGWSRRPPRRRSSSARRPHVRPAAGCAR